MRLTVHVQFLPIHRPTFRLKALDLADCRYKTIHSQSIYVEPSPTIGRPARRQCRIEPRFRVSAIVIVSRVIIAVHDVRATYIVLIPEQQQRDHFGYQPEE